MNFDCPKCGGPGKKGSVRGMMQCTSCLHYYQVEEEPPAPEPAPEFVPKSSRRTTSGQGSDTTTSRQKIVRLAEGFEILAVVFAVIGFIALVFFIFSLTNSPSLTAAYFFSGSFGAALWLYLIAQIVHIRANTER